MVKAPSTSQRQVLSQAMTPNVANELADFACDPLSSLFSDTDVKRR
jgi:hypothetical protein